MWISDNKVETCSSTKYDKYKWPEFKGVAYYQDTTGIIDGRVPATGLWINEKNSLTVGRSFALKTRVYPFGSTDKVTYTSSNTNVATIDVNGRVKAVAKGTTQITVSVNGIKKSFTLTVN